MNAPKLIPTGSQTVGPYFRIGLGILVGQEPAVIWDSTRLRFAVRCWIATVHRFRMRCLNYGGPISSGDIPASLPNSSGQANWLPSRRDGYDGNFHVGADKPGATALGDGRFQAPHMLVLVFARGLLRHLITRVYFENEAGNAEDPVLLKCPRTPAHAYSSFRRSNPRLFQWNVILQGDNETVFFAW